MIRITIHLVRLMRVVEEARQQLHKLYKLFVPPRWRTPARWVWGITAVVAMLWGQAGQEAPPLTVYFYDVGQGDAIHVRTSQGFDVLIDGGPTGRVVEKLGRTMPFWDNTVELMILTHPHADHVVGQIEVLRRFQVKKVLVTGVLHTTDEYLAWLKGVQEQGVPMEIARAGQRWSLGLGPAGGDSAIQGSSSARLRLAADAPKIAPPHRQSPALAILWPEEEFTGKRVAEGKIGEGGGLNDTSIVARLTFGKTSFLLMGDATSAVEEELVHSRQFGIDSNYNTTNYKLLSTNSRLRADVLKVGHHGSKYSTSRAFLEAVQPKYAVIQVGKNRYGHPAYAPLYRLKQAGVEVLRNDQDGEVVMESDGTRVRIVNPK